MKIALDTHNKFQEESINNIKKEKLIHTKQNESMKKRIHLWSLNVS